MPSFFCHDGMGECKSENELATQLFLHYCVFPDLTLFV